MFRRIIVSICLLFVIFMTSLTGCNSEEPVYVTPNSSLSLPPLSAEKKLLYEDTIMKITLKEIGYEASNETENTSVNASDRNAEKLIIIAEIEHNDEKLFHPALFEHSAIVNDSITVPAELYLKVLSDKKMLIKLVLDPDYYLNNGIKNVGDIKFKLKSVGWDDAYDFLTDFLNVQTSLMDQMETTVNISDAIDFYDKDGIYIKGKYVDTFGVSSQKGILLFVKNRSGQDIRIMSKDVSVNGNLLDQPGRVLPSLIFSNTEAISFLDLQDEFLKDLTPNEIIETSLSLNILDVNYHPIAETDAVFNNK